MSPKLPGAFGAGRHCPSAELQYWVEDWYSLVAVLVWGSSAVVVHRSLARYEGILVLVGLPVVELESEGMAPVEWSILAEICSRLYL